MLGGAVSLKRSTSPAAIIRAKRSKFARFEEKPLLSLIPVRPHLIDSPGPLLATSHSLLSVLDTGMPGYTVVAIPPSTTSVLPAALAGERHCASLEKSVGRTVLGAATTGAFQYELLWTHISPIAPLPSHADVFEESILSILDDMGEGVGSSSNDGLPRLIPR
jgi:hypothetical protein